MRRVSRENCDGRLTKRLGRSSLVSGAWEPLRRTTSAAALMTLEARLWLALAILAGVMCALLFGTAGTTQYWQAWVYVSIFLGASVLTTFCVDPMSVAIRRADVRDLQKIETVARAAWPVVYAGIIPDEIQRRLLDS